MCNWTHTEGSCTARADRAAIAEALGNQAYDKVREIERATRDADLFSPPRELLDFWWGVHAACGREFRRLERLFWRRCPHNGWPMPTGRLP